MARNRKHKLLDENFFEIIDSEDKAYFLGLLYADGYHNTKTHSINLGLESTDEYVVKYLASLLLDTGKVYYNKNGNKVECKFSTTSEKLSNDLLDKGLFKAKSLILQYPDFLDVNLHRHFIRGYFDGDGCISIGKNNKVTFVGTKLFLGKLQEILIRDLNLNKTKLWEDLRKTNPLYTLCYTGRYNIIKIKDFLYQNANIFLKRKYDKFKLNG